MRMWFEFARTKGFPTHYPSQHTPAHVDVLTSGFILAFALIAFSLFLTLPAYKLTRALGILCQIIFTLSIGAIIILGNYGPDWEVSHLKIKAPYKPGLPDEIKADIGLHISLRGINITLKGVPASKESVLKTEMIDYNENFSWEWAQGRFGFGPYAGRFNREYRAAAYKGLPIPILSLAEYFTFDGEGIRFGRHYRQSGYFAHILLWIAFVTWIISNILFFMIVSQGAMYLMLTGFLQLMAIAIWTLHRNHVELSVPFELASPYFTKEHGLVMEDSMKTHFGPDYYLVALNGVVCLILGGVIYILNSMFSDAMCNFFGIDPLTTYAEHWLSKEEYDKEEIPKDSNTKIPDIEMSPLSMTPAEEEISFDQKRDSELSESHLVLRRHKGFSIGNISFRKSKKPILPARKPQPLPRGLFKQSKVKGSPEPEMESRALILKKDDAEQYGSVETPFLKRSYQ